MPSSARGAGSAAGTSDFSAFLLGLRAGMQPAGATAGLGIEGEATPPAPGFDGLPMAIAPVAPTPLAEGTAAAADAASGVEPGTGLPTDGTELPPGELEELLAALNLAGPITAPTAQVAVTPPSVPTPGDGTGEATGGTLAPAKAGNAPASTEPIVRSGPAADGPFDTAPYEPAGGVPGTDERAVPASNAGTRSLSDPGATSAADSVLPPDFGARLEALLAPASTTTTGSGPPDGTWSALATSATLGPTSPTAGPATQSAALAPFDTLPALRPLAEGEAWTQGLGERLLLMAERGLQSATIRLQPEHLGPMEIRIEVDGDGAAQVLFSAHHAQTREALENAIPRLRELFADQGLTLTQANVDSGRGAFAQRDFAHPASPWRQWAATESDAPALASERAWQVTRGSPRRVDVFV